MNDIILIGGGGHCKSVIDVIEQEGKFNIVGIIDRPEFLNSKCLGYPIIGTDSDLDDLAKKYKYALITLGQLRSPLPRIKLFDLAIKANFVIPSIISPQAYLSKHAIIGQGVVVMNDALINANAIIGDNCIINSKALIEHDAIIESHCHISTHATINGKVKVEKNCFVGSGVTTNHSIIIKKDSFIKAGSLVKISN
jgi:sugar O-acyltransferase (sialic acid O-acetyltransferase NeuD family)